MKTTDINDLPFSLLLVDSKISTVYSIPGNFRHFKFILKEGKLVLDNAFARLNLLSLVEEPNPSDWLYNSLYLNNILDTMDLINYWEFDLNSLSYEEFLEKVGVLKLNDLEYIFTPQQRFQLL